MRRLENDFNSNSENQKRQEFFEKNGRNIKINTEKNNISMNNNQSSSNSNPIDLLGHNASNSKISFSTNTPTNKLSKLKLQNDNLKNLKFNIPRVSFFIN